MKEAVAVDINIYEDFCDILIYHPNSASLRAARNERLRLSAISTPVTGDSFWLGNEPYAALYEYGESSEFEFALNKTDIKSSVDTIVNDLGFSRLRNAHSVQCLRVKHSIDTSGFVNVKKFFFLDYWKVSFSTWVRAAGSTILLRIY